MPCAGRSIRNAAKAAPRSVEGSTGRLRNRRKTSAPCLRPEYLGRTRDHAVAQAVDPHDVELIQGEVGEACAELAG